MLHAKLEPQQHLPLRVGFDRSTLPHDYCTRDQTTAAVAEERPSSTSLPPRKHCQNDSTPYIAVGKQQAPICARYETFYTYQSAEGIPIPDLEYLSSEKLATTHPSISQVSPMMAPWMTPSVA